MIRHPRVLIGTVAAVPALVIIALALAAGGARAGQSESRAAFVGLDADPVGSTATSLGTIDYCHRVEPGVITDVDLVVDEIPADRPIIAFEMHITYDPAVVEVTAIDEHFLLGAVGSFQPTSPLTDILPDRDGDFRLSVLDLASNGPPGANMESGPGVLTRITFRGLAAGVTTLGIVADPPNAYPAMFDDQNTVITVDDVGSAALAIGQPCPAQPAGGSITPVPIPADSETPGPDATADGSTGTPSTDGDADNGDGSGEDSSPTPGPGTPDLSSPSGQATATAVAAQAGGPDDDGDSGGTSTLLIVVLVVAGVALAGGGGWALYRRRLKRS
jgi:hypothetical protein